MPGLQWPSSNVSLNLSDGFYCSDSEAFVATTLLSTLRNHENMTKTFGAHFTINIVDARTCGQPSPECRDNETRRAAKTVSFLFHIF